MSLLSYKWKSSKLIDHSYAVCMGVLSASIVGLIFYLLHTPKPVVTVDVNHIVSQFVKAESAQKISHDEEQKHIQVFAKRLEDTLHVLALDEGVVIMPKEAVLSGAKDLTLEVEKRMTDVQG